MKHIRKERNRLLNGSARFLGLSAAIVSVACVLVPGAVDLGLAVPVLVLVAALAFSQYRLGVTGRWVWVASILATGAAAVAVLNIASAGSGVNASAGNAIAAIIIAALGCTSVVLARDLIGFVIGAVCFAGMVALIIFTAPREYLVGLILVTTVAWLMGSVVGSWLSASVPRVMRRINSIGRAHTAERQASETEAQRRQGARLLHDTVLATLTLLAHSGVGVTPEALRQQSADDARLLRQLRIGDVAPAPRHSGIYQLATADETALGTTLESVKQRFHRMGLEVSWHGTGQVLLPTDILDSFLLALAECLENVRRHSGVTDAHVTITDDDVTVRAMVTDAGVGFDLGDIDDEKLGFKESVVARLRDVGGNARLFSSPGSGTTVVLEVPK